MNISVNDVPLSSVYIDGEWHSISQPVAQQTLYNPATGEAIANAALAGAAEAKQAIAAAHAALPAWQNSSVETRSKLLKDIADALQQRRERLIELSCLNSGKPLAEAAIDVDDAIATYRYYAELIERTTLQERLDDVSPNHALYRRNEAVGVCALIVPWNFPMVTTAWKLAPALAAGCSVILKPSELTLLPEMLLGDVLSEIGAPAGVVNILPGSVEAAKAMIDDDRVRKVSFTGSNQVGEQVMQQAAKRMQKVSLELGGKSPIVVFDDVDLDWAVTRIIGGIFMNAGQVCSATSRLIVADSIADECYARLKQAAEGLTIGEGYAESTEMGPLVCKAQQQRAERYYAQARAEGLHCLCGGYLPNRAGYFAAPTIYTDVPTDSRLWREEIFAPVLVTARFHDEAEAIALANDSDYGLAATVLSADTSRGWRVLEQIDAGAIWLNDDQLVSPRAGWGGYKLSGIGRELGTEGLKAYQESKYIIAPL